MLDIHFTEFNTKVFAYLLGHVLRLGAGKNLKRG